MAQVPYFQIVAGGGGHLAVVDQDHRPIVIDTDLRNEQEALGAIEAIGAERGLLLNVIRTKDGRIDRVEARRAVNLSLAVTPELDELITRLASDLGATKAATLMRGVALLRAAVDARRAGKVVGSAESPDSLETEFVGF